MMPTAFRESNVVLGANQPEYLPLPAFVDQSDQQGNVITCWQLTWRERFLLAYRGTMWLSQFTFHRGFQPQRPSVESPFVGDDE